MRHDRLQRVISLLLALCLFCAGHAVAAPVCGDEHQAVAAGTANELSCEHDRSSDLPAASVYQQEITQLTGYTFLAVRRPPRHWVAHALGSDTRTCAAHWLQARAHDPPKSIRFCTFLN